MIWFSFEPTDERQDSPQHLGMIKVNLKTENDKLSHRFGKFENMMAPRTLPH